jgi:pimeloyl-ACP methyl ester carboxylesterase
MRRWLILLIVWLVPSAAALRAADHDFDPAGVKLHYIDEGQGEAVLLVHGFAINSRLQWYFSNIAQTLAKKYHVISLDCRGHGLSGKPHDPKLYGQQMAEDVIRLLDHLKIRKAHVVGYSMGGYIVLNLLATHPDRLLSVTTGGAGVPRTVDVDFLNKLADALEQGKGMGLLLRRLSAPGQPEPSAEDIKRANRLLSMFNDPKALAAAIRSLKNLAPPEKALEENKVPVLAIVGALDPLKSQVDEMKGRLADLKTVVIRGADHMDAFEKPQFLSALTDFLAAHSTSDVNCCEPASGSGR